jgi:hypothetical protein
MTEPRQCCFVLCESSAAIHSGFGEAVCAGHWELASVRTRRRVLRTASRLRRLEQLWTDLGSFEKLVAEGRYLKLCTLLDYAAEQAEVSWSRLKLELFAATVASAADANPLFSLPIRRVGRPSRGG